jgi:hypothetical protein
MMSVRAKIGECLEVEAAENREAERIDVEARRIGERRRPVMHGRKIRLQ